MLSHRDSPGLQSMHWSFSQEMPQVTMSPHVPFGPHTCISPALLQRVASGSQSPHRSPTHSAWHAAGAPQVPLCKQSRTSLSLTHSVPFGTQSLHTPLLHWVLHGVAVPQVPSQSWTLVGVSHRVLPGRHSLQLSPEHCVSHLTGLSQ